MEIIEMGSIRDIDPERWDTVVGDDPAALHGWLRAFEETRLDSTQLRYWIGRDATGILAALPATVYGPASSSAGVIELLFGSWRVGRIPGVASVLGLGAGPAIVGGPPMGVGASILVRRGLDDASRSAAARTLLRAVEAQADGCGGSVWLRGGGVETQACTGVFDPGRYGTSIEMPTTCLDVTWDSLSDFRMALRVSHPSSERNIRLKSNRLRRAGIEIEEVVDPAPLERTLHHLLDRHSRRLNGKPFPTGPEFPTKLKRYLGDRALIRIARSGSRILGVSIALRHRRVIHYKPIGLDETHSLRSEVYHGLSLYQPIEQAPRTGVRRVFFGTHAYEPKLRLGSSLEERSVHVRGQGVCRTRLLRAILGVRSRLITRRIVELSGGASAHGSRRPLRPEP
jgi:hypothetical protein